MSKNNTKNNINVFAQLSFIFGGTMVAFTALKLAIPLNEGWNFLIAILLILVVRTLLISTIAFKWRYLRFIVRMKSHKKNAYRILMVLLILMISGSLIYLGIQFINQNKKVSVTSALNHKQKETDSTTKDCESSKTTDCIKASTNKKNEKNSQEGNTNQPSTYQVGSENDHRTTHVENTYHNRKRGFILIGDASNGIWSYTDYSKFIKIGTEANPLAFPKEINSNTITILIYTEAKADNNGKKVKGDFSYSVLNIRKIESDVKTEYWAEVSLNE